MSASSVVRVGEGEQRWRGMAWLLFALDAVGVEVAKGRAGSAGSDRDGRASGRVGRSARAFHAEPSYRTG
ncbi:MAG TPA: hypothetical protein DEB06_04280, partial [Phycisphaerales bacterium]|nr:hypothetical protein [Phycisphaerales bacterium]